MVSPDDTIYRAFDGIGVYVRVFSRFFYFWIWYLFIDGSAAKSHNPWQQCFPGHPRSKTRQDVAIRYTNKNPHTYMGSVLHIPYIYSRLSRLITNAVSHHLINRRRRVGLHGFFSICFSYIYVIYFRGDCVTYMHRRRTGARHLWMSAWVT